MKFAIFNSVAAIGILATGTLFAADAKKDDAHSGKQCFQAKITKINAQKHEVTVKMMDKDGKDATKTLHVSDDAKYQDGSGDDAKLNSFHDGDDVLISEKDDKVTEIKKHVPAQITKMDGKTGTITVKMMDKNGKEVEKTFQLIEETSYVDSTGKVAVLEVFKSGDEILMVEADGQIQAMKKSDKQKQHPDQKSDKKKEN